MRSAEVTTLATPLVILPRHALGRGKKKGKGSKVETFTVTQTVTMTVNSNGIAMSAVSFQLFQP